jgi:hypothetical protein
VKEEHGVALGFVGARVLEAAIIVAGVVSLLAVVTLRQAGAGTDAVVTGQALVALHDRTMLLGQKPHASRKRPPLELPALQSRLVPRMLPVLGFLGAPLLIASTTTTLFNITEPVSTWTALAALPIALWELSLGIWLITKGFTPSPITADMTATRTTPTHQDAAHR